MSKDAGSALDMLGQEFSRYLALRSKERLKLYKKQPPAPEKKEAAPEGCEKCKTGDCDIPEHLEEAVAQLDGFGAEDSGGDDHDPEE